MSVVPGLRTVSISAIVVAAISLVAHAFNPTNTNETAPKADAVFGQPNFTSNASGTGVSSFNNPVTAAFDSYGVMYVTDFTNDRVLVFTSQSDTIADTVVGGPLNGVASDRLNGPAGVVCWDGPNTSVLFVADLNNHRVLGYITRAPSFGGTFFPDTIADYVFGQPLFTSNVINNNGVGGSAVSAIAIQNPHGIWVLDTGAAAISLWVADHSNHRVLRFDISKALLGGSNAAMDTTADAVWGQPGFTTNSSGTSNARLNFPYDVVAAPERLFILDASNNRLVVESLTDADTVFDAVYGQPNFTTGSTGSDTFKMNFPAGLALAPSRSFLAISDFTNGRILIHTDTSGADTTPDFVIGDTDFLASPVAYVTDTTLDGPYHLTFRSDTQLFVPVYNHHRVLRFDSLFSTAEAALGVENVVNSTSGSVTFSSPATTSETFVQVNLSGGAVTVGDSVALRNEATTAGSIGDYSTADYTCTSSLVNSGDTLVVPIWTNQSSMRIFSGLRTDTSLVPAANLPAGLPDNDTGRRVLGSLGVLLEFADSTSRLIGNSQTTSFVGDSFAYSLRYFVSLPTVVLLRSMGVDTTPGASSLVFYYSDTWAGRWIEDTTVAVRIRGGNGPHALEIVASGITKDLPGVVGPPGAASSIALGSSGGCLFRRGGTLERFILRLRNLRDWAIGSSIGRLLVSLYYSSQFGKI